MLWHRRKTGGGTNEEKSGTKNKSVNSSLFKLAIDIHSGCLIWVIKNNYANLASCRIDFDSHLFFFCNRQCFLMFEIQFIRLKSRYIFFTCKDKRTQKRRYIKANLEHNRNSLQSNLQNRFVSSKNVIQIEFASQKNRQAGVLNKMAINILSSCFLNVSFDVQTSIWYYI